MIQLTSQNMQLHAHAVTKEEAIRAAGHLLIETGNIESAYVESMLGREQQANTYLGNGIAIPHGMGKDRELIRQTGVCVVQLPDGVEWGDGQTVRLVIGIAAKSDEHLEILAALTGMLDDPEIGGRLANTNDPADIIAILNRPQNDTPVVPTETLTDAKQVDVILRPGAGLHARPATNLVAIANAFSSEIQIICNGKVANGKAMASLLKLGAEGEATLGLLARGEDADEALATLKKAIESGLGDEAEKPLLTDGCSWVPEESRSVIKGVCASPGIAMGPLRYFRAQQIVVADTTGDPNVELQKLQGAIASAKTQLHEIQATMRSTIGKNEAAIFLAHEAFLTDPELFDEASTLIKAGHSAAWSWQQAIENRVGNMKRAADLYDVGQRVLRLLTKDGDDGTELPDEPCILVADDLMPSDTTTLDPQLILGFVTVAGGPTSHTAIIARSLGIPAVVGAGAAVLKLTEGSTCILEGTAGSLYTAPNKKDIESAQQFQNHAQLQRDNEHHQRYQPALMTDGHRIEIAANIAKATDAAAAIETGAEGVGLLRTEFLFLEREMAPTEEEQFEAYSEMTKALGGLPLIIRTLDIGGDKVVPYLSLPKEDNPFLGIRGIRLCLSRPDLFLPQLRAIYRASVTGPVKIMFPMVATLDDLRAAKKMAEQVRAELDVPPVEIGIMVEVPSAAVLAAEFAKECDFFSIGTNDLTQYTLAMDRMHPTLGSQVDGLNPAVLRLIDQTVRGAQSEGRWVGACGGVAGDPLGATILVGLGVIELSMSIPSIPGVKAHLRGTSLASAQDLARRALACTSVDQVHALKG